MFLWVIYDVHLVINDVTKGGIKNVQTKADAINGNISSKYQNIHIPSVFLRFYLQRSYIVHVKIFNIHLNIYRSSIAPPSRVKITK